MNRRELLKLSVLGAAASAAPAAGAEKDEKAAPKPDKNAAPPPFEFANKSLKGLQAELKAGNMSSAQLTEAYIKRIELTKPLLHAVLEVNPDALPFAEAMDGERKAKNLKGPLHG